MNPHLIPNNIYSKITYQIPHLKNHKISRAVKIPNIHTPSSLPFADILTPLNPLHGGIGFIPMTETSSRMTAFVKVANYLKPEIMPENSDIIHGFVFVNNYNVIEATSRYKKYNGRNEITEATKENTSIYISKFPFLNMMIVQEMDKLTGGGYNFVGTINCLIGHNIIPQLKENDFFCSQMILKAVKNALERYEKTPLLPYKQDIKNIADTLKPLNPDTTLPAEIKQAFDTIPNYFIILSSPFKK